MPPAAGPALPSGKTGANGGRSDERPESGHACRIASRRRESRAGRHSLATSKTGASAMALIAPAFSFRAQVCAG